MTAASAFLPGLDGAAVAHCDGGPRGHPGAALGPTHSFSLFYLSPFVDPTAGERKARFCPVPLPPLSRPHAPASLSWGPGLSLPLPSLGLCPSFLSLSHSPALLHTRPCIPTQREVTFSTRPRRAGGEGAAGRPPRLSVLSAIPWCVAGTGPQPLPSHRPPALPCRHEALGRGGDKGVPSLLSPPAAQVPWGPRAPSPIYIYKYNPRNKPETTRDQRCVLPGGTGQSSRSLRSRRAAPLPSHGASPRASPLPAQPSFPSVHPSSVRPSLLPAWSPGAPLQCGTSQGQAIVPPVPCCRWEMLPQ